jgi:hypothetical protein
VSPPLVLAGTALPDWVDLVRRYCGLQWSGGRREVWAYQYFDADPSISDDVVSTRDVLAVCALHPGLTRANLAWFVDQNASLTDLLTALPTDVHLADAPAAVLSALEAIEQLADPERSNLALLSKVLHRKRPLLIPMLDRAITDWYRPLTGARGAAAWSPLLQALQTDLAQRENRTALADPQTGLAEELRFVPTPLRLADIAIWMSITTKGARPS